MLTLGACRDATDSAMAVDVEALHTDILEHPVVELFEPIDDGALPQRAQDRRRQVAQGAADSRRRNGLGDGGRRHARPSITFSLAVNRVMIVPFRYNSSGRQPLPALPLTTTLI